MKNKAYRFIDTVLLFTDDSRIYSEVKKIAKEQNLNIFVADSPSDLLGIPYFVGIVDPKYIRKKDLEYLEELYSKQNSKEFSIVITKEIKLEIPKKIKRLFVIEPDKIDYQFLKDIIVLKKEYNEKHPERFGK